MEHRVGATSTALGKGAGVDAKGAPHVLHERSELGREEEDCGKGNLEKSVEYHESSSLMKLNGKCHVKRK
jgi:hypothetical protein